MDEPLLENIEPDIEYEYITDIFKKILKIYHRSEMAGIYESDLWFDMFCVEEQYWWMSIDHPYVAMIVENNALSDGSYPMSQLLNGGCGRVVVYTSSVMRECISTIKNMCQRHNYKINEDEP